MFPFFNQMDHIAGQRQNRESQCNEKQLLPCHMPYIDQDDGSHHQGKGPIGIHQYSNQQGKQDILQQIKFGVPFIHFFLFPANHRPICDTALINIWSSAYQESGLSQTPDPLRQSSIFHAPDALVDTHSGECHHIRTRLVLHSAEHATVLMVVIGDMHIGCALCHGPGAYD